MITKVEIDLRKIENKTRDLEPVKDRGRNVQTWSQGQKIKTTNHKNRNRLGLVTIVLYFVLLPP